MANNSLNSTTQQYLDIYDITNDIVVMKNGSASVILSVSALNFGLLAEEEQDAIIYSYAGLLNSINYSIEILVRSQTKDVTNYLQLLKEQEESAEDRLKSQRISRYREFVANLIQERNVLDKKFFVIITATPIEMGVISTQSVVPGVASPDITTFEKSVIIERAKNNLEPKRDHLVAQFGRIGLYSRQLKTQEIIQLFYVSYNPEAAEGQLLTESKNYTTPLVNASVQGNIMNDQNPVQPVISAAPVPTPPIESAPVVPGLINPTPVNNPPSSTQPNPTPSINPASTSVSPDDTITTITPPEPTQLPITAPVAPVEPTPIAENSIDLQNEINSTIKQLGGQPTQINASVAPIAPIVPTTPVTPTTNAPTGISETSAFSVSAPTVPELPEI